MSAAPCRLVSSLDVVDRTSAADDLRQRNVTDLNIVVCPAALWSLNQIGPQYVEAEDGTYEELDAANLTRNFLRQNLVARRRLDLNLAVVRHVAYYESQLIARRGLQSTMVARKILFGGCSHALNFGGLLHTGEPPHQHNRFRAQKSALSDKSDELPHAKSPR
jgi:hypothetical protein